MNIFKRLFKRPKDKSASLLSEPYLPEGFRYPVEVEPFLQQKDWKENVRETMQEMVKNKLISEKAFSAGFVTPTIKYTSPFSKLTKSELIALESCIQFTLAGANTIGVEHNLRKAITMKALTDKGYLVRIKKGHYKLSFYK